MATELFKRISESLGLEENYIHKQMDLDEGIQIMSVNHYPPCPQPASAMGLPPHSDHSFVSLLIQNGIDGLEILHKEKWVPVYPPINSFVVNVGDHLEVYLLTWSIYIFANVIIWSYVYLLVNIYIYIVQMLQVILELRLLTWFTHTQRIYISKLTNAQKRNATHRKIIVKLLVILTCNKMIH